MLRYKTRILITHAIDLLDKVDRVIVVKQGRIIHQGHFDQLKNLEYFQTMLNNIKKNQNTEEVKEDLEHHNSNEQQESDLEDSEDDITHRGSTINNDENKEKIVVNWKSFYKFLFYSYSTIIAFVFAVLILYLRRQIFVLFSYYLLKWVRKVSKTFENDKEMFKMIVITKIIQVVIIIASFLISIVFTLTISIRLFRKMLRHLLFAPVNMFFDITPSGVILNRFSKDFRTVEVLLTANVTSQVFLVTTIILTIALAALNFIWILVIVPVIAISLIFCYVLYVKGLKEATRIEAITSSPILTHLNESINGVSTIRVYGKIDEFEQKQYFLQDRNGACLLMIRAIQGWFNRITTFIIVIFLSFAFIT